MPHIGNFIERQDGNLHLDESEPKTFSEALSFCKSKGASLLMITSVVKQNMIENLYKHNPIWLALYASTGGQQLNWFTPETKIALSYSNWAPHQSNKTERCVIAPSGKKDWIKFPCNSKAEVVCEKKKTGKSIFIKGAMPAK